MLKHVFSINKSPSMVECSSLAQNIGLQKRVVQVWFQNARCKDKKARQQYRESMGRDVDTETRSPAQCSHCPGAVVSGRSELLEHVMTHTHLDHVRDAIERNQYHPPTPGVLQGIVKNYKQFLKAHCLQIFDFVLDR